MAGLTGACILTITIVYIAMIESGAQQLLKGGARTPGVVLAYRSLPRLGGEYAVEYAVRGHARIGIISETSQRRRRGERIVVIYDPANPGRIRTLQEVNDMSHGVAVLIAFALVFGAGLILATIGALRHALHWHLILSKQSWQAYRVTDPPTWRRRRGAPPPGITLARVRDDSAESLTLRLGTTARWRTAKLKAAPVVWLAGDPQSKVVIGIPSTRELFAAMPKRRRA